MANRFNFVNVGAAAGQGMREYLGEREAARIREVAMAEQAARLKLAQDQEARLAEQSAAALKQQQDQLEFTRATTIANMAGADERVTPDTAALMQRAGLGGRVESRAPVEAELASAQLPMTVALPGTTPTPDTPQLPAVFHPEVQAQAGGDFLKPGFQYEQARTAEEARKEVAEMNARERARLAAEARADRVAGREDAQTFRTELQEDAQENARLIASIATSNASSRRDTSTFNSIASEAGRSPLVKAADRTVILDAAVDAIRENPKDPARQQMMAYSWIQVLDTYASAVREGEISSLDVLGNRADQLKVAALRYLPPSLGGAGAFMTEAVAKNIAETAVLASAAIAKGKDKKMKEFGARAEVSGVGDLWNEYMEKAGLNPPSSSSSKGGNVGKYERVP